MTEECADENSTCNRLRRNKHPPAGSHPNRLNDLIEATSAFREKNEVNRNPESRKRRNTSCGLSGTLMAKRCINEGSSTCIHAGQETTAGLAVSNKLTIVPAKSPHQQPAPEQQPLDRDTLLIDPSPEKVEVQNCGAAPGRKSPCQTFLHERDASPLVSASGFTDGEVMDITAVKTLLQKGRTSPWSEDNPRLLRDQREHSALLHKRTLEYESPPTTVIGRHPHNPSEMKWVSATDLSSKLEELLMYLTAANKEIACNRIARPTEHSSRKEAADRDGRGELYRYCTIDAGMPYSGPTEPITYKEALGKYAANGVCEQPKNQVHHDPPVPPQSGQFESANQQLFNKRNLHLRSEIELHKSVYEALKCLANLGIDSIFNSSLQISLPIAAVRHNHDLLEYASKTITSANQPHKHLPDKSCADHPRSTETGSALPLYVKGQVPPDLEVSGWHFDDVLEYSRNYKMWRSAIDSGCLETAARLESTLRMPSAHQTHQPIRESKGNCSDGFDHTQRLPSPKSEFLAKRELAIPEPVKRNLPKTSASTNEALPRASLREGLRSRHKMNRDRADQPRSNSLPSRRLSDSPPLEYALLCLNGQLRRKKDPATLNEPPQGMQSVISTNTNTPRPSDDPTNRFCVKTEPTKHTEGLRTAMTVPESVRNSPKNVTSKDHTSEPLFCSLVESDNHITSDGVRAAEHMGSLRQGMNQPGRPRPVISMQPQQGPPLPSSTSDSGASAQRERIGDNYCNRGPPTVFSQNRFGPAPLIRPSPFRLNGVRCIRGHAYRPKVRMTMGGGLMPNLSPEVAQRGNLCPYDEIECIPRNAPPSHFIRYTNPYRPRMIPPQIRSTHTRPVALKSRQSPMHPLPQSVAFPDDPPPSDDL